MFRGVGEKGLDRVGGRETGVMTIAIVAAGDNLCGESRGKLLSEHFHMFDSIFHIGFPHGFEPKSLIKRREVGLCGNPNS